MEEQKNNPQNPEHVAIRMDRRTVIFVRREKYEHLGRDECIRRFHEHREKARQGSAPNAFF